MAQGPSNRLGRLILGVAVLVGLVALADGLGWLDPARGFAAEKISPDCPSQVRFTSEDRPFDFVTDYYGLRYRGNTGNLIDAHVLFYGAFEKPVLRFLGDVASGDGVFVDVGANVGTHTLFMAGHASEVHAFEPFPPVLARLHAAIEENDLHNVVVHEVGLGNEADRIPFAPPSGDNHGIGAFVRDLEIDEKLLPTFEIVPGDEALASLGRRTVEIVKIDVEGFEKPVLHGLARTLDRDRPIVVFELSVDTERQHAFTSGDDLAATFPEGYRFLVFEDGRDSRCSGRYELAPFRFDVKDKAVHQVVAYPRDRDSEIPRRAY